MDLYACKIGNHRTNYYSVIYLHFSISSYFSDKFFKKMQRDLPCSVFVASIQFSALMTARVILQDRMISISS